MKNRAKATFDFVKDVAQNFGAHNVGVIAAGVAFFALLSLFPTILLLLASIGFLVADPETSQREVVNYILSQMPSTNARKDFERLVTDIVRGALNPRSQVTGIGLLLLAYSVSRVFGGLQVAMNVIFGVKQGRNFIMGKVVPFLAVFGMLLTIFTSLAVSSVLRVLNESSKNYFGWLPGTEIFFRLLNAGVSLALLTVVFALMYRFLPANHVGWRDVLFGGLIAAVLWSIVKEIVALAPGLVGLDPTYGTIGVLLAFVSWIYITLQIIMLGAEIAAERARRGGNEDVRARSRDEAAGQGPEKVGKSLPTPASAAVVAGQTASAQTEWPRNYAGRTEVGARNVLLVMVAAAAALLTGRLVRARGD